MLTIKDLNVSKELDSKAMAGVSGGTYHEMPEWRGVLSSLEAYIQSPRNEVAAAGDNFNSNIQEKNDYATNTGNGQANVIGNISNTTDQASFAFVRSLVG